MAAVLRWFRRWDHKSCSVVAGLFHSLIGGGDIVERVMKLYGALRGKLMAGSSYGPSTKKIIVRVVLTYLVVLMATLGFTGIIDYWKEIKPVVKFAGKVFERKKTTAKKTDTSQPEQNYPVSITPIILPGPVTTPITSSTPTTGAQAQVAQENVRELAKVYSSMDSEQAVKIFDNLTDNEVIMLLKEMRGMPASDILAEMDSVRAAKITGKMMSTTVSTQNIQLNPRFRVGNPQAGGQFGGEGWQGGPRQGFGGGGGPPMGP